MKNKLKTRLFTALALSGVSFYWPASELLAQQGDFGFIRPAEPTRQDDREQSVPPITQVPPIVSATSSRLVRPNNTTATYQPATVVPPVVQASHARITGASSGPKPFAASSVYNGAYVESGAGNVGYAQHVSPSETEGQTARQVAYDEPSSVMGRVPVVSGLQAQRDLPPIVETAQSSAHRFAPQVVQPMQQNEMPPILSSARGQRNTALPTIVSPTAGLDRLLQPIPSTLDNVANTGMVQEEVILGTDNQSSQVRPASAYGPSPLYVQDAPPAIDPGSLPSADGILVPVDPAIDLPLGGGDTFPRATPLDTPNGTPRSVLDQNLGIQPSTQPRPTFFDPNQQQQAPVFGNSVDGGIVGAPIGTSACSSCGENGCFDQAAVDAQFNTSGSNAYARRYFIAEALYLVRSDGDIFNSNRGSLSEFDFEGGARFTVGRREDSTSGREFQYTGTDKIGQTIDTTDATGSIQSLFVPTGGLSFNDIPSFFNATEQSQSKESYFHSLEFNKVKWGWDVIKSYVGLRYLFFDDEYTLFSQNAANIGPDGSLDLPQSGVFRAGTTNNLIGPHVGGELYYDVGYRLSLSGFSRLGAYVNFSEFTETLDNNGVRLIDEQDTNTTLSYTYEAGINAKYRLSQQSQFRIGYNIYFWDRLATVSDNLVNSGAGVGVGPSFLGAGTSDSDSVFINGFSVGFEFYR